MRAAGGDHLHGRAEACEVAVVRCVEAVASVQGVAQRLDGKPRPGRIDGVVALVTGCRGVLERAALEHHALHVPQGDMVEEEHVLGEEEVVVVEGEGAVVEPALVVADVARGEGVGVGEELHGAAVVAEGGVGALYDAAGGEPLLVSEAGLDGAVGVLDGGPVAEDDGALVGGGLVLGAVAHHLDALPHLAGAGRGQRAAVHDELATGTDDEAGSSCTI